MNDVTLHAENANTIYFKLLDCEDFAAFFKLYGINLNILDYHLTSW